MLIRHQPPVAEPDFRIQTTLKLGHFDPKTWFSTHRNVHFLYEPFAVSLAFFLLLIRHQLLL